ncbi:hypothetical protein ACIGW3_26025 [Streptomyces sp. NPDC053499]|uniref:hypothetical protein n=1 Tax=Streptomyces sp. NPDC053499 TaxID=3365707 RepID=UPI0037D19F0D
MSERECVMSGPHPIYVDAMPAGAVLDVEAFVTGVVQDAVEALLSDEFADRLAELAEVQPSDPHAVQVPSDLHMESLVSDLVKQVETRMPLYGGQVQRLASALGRLVQPRPVPGQRREGGAAA